MNRRLVPQEILLQVFTDEVGGVYDAKIYLNVVNELADDITAIYNVISTNYFSSVAEGETPISQALQIGYMAKDYMVAMKASELMREGLKDIRRLIQTTGGRSEYDDDIKLHRHIETLIISY